MFVYLFTYLANNSNSQLQQQKQQQHMDRMCNQSARNGNPIFRAGSKTSLAIALGGKVEGFYADYRFASNNLLELLLPLLPLLLLVP